MRVLLALMLSIALAIPGCSDSSKLTRKKAKALIVQADMRASNGVVTAEIPKTSDSNIQEMRWDRDKITGNSLISLMSRFANEGLLTYRNDGIPAGGVRDIKLTEKGEKFVVGQSTSGNPLVKLCVIESYEVTGIEKPTENSAIVHFTIKTKSITPFGLAAPKITSSKNNTFMAKMSLFDDGWRLTGVAIEQLPPL
jgi:hypothetical protein